MKSEKNNNREIDEICQHERNTCDFPWREFNMRYTQFKTIKREMNVSVD